MKKYYLYILLMFWLTSYGQDAVLPFDMAYRRIYTITGITGARPVIDGRLDEACWAELGEWSDNFVQVSPYERVASSSPTRVKLFYDDACIYVGIYCKDANPEKMNRFINVRDANGIGDLVSIAFDTYHDYRAAPEFNLNLGGNKTDLIVTDKLAVNLSWNAVWEAKTSINMADSSWTAEMKIPFSQLRYNWKSDDGVWGLHVRRIIRRNNEVQNWSMIPLKNNGHVFSFGEMHGMNELPKPRSIELLPYVMGKYSSRPSMEGNPYRNGGSWGANAGLDAKFALSDFTLDLTVNPDFGQVELDPSVMNLTAYETFYDEKRPFFLEGKHIFDFGSGSDMMFYSRRLGSSPSYTPAGIDNISSFAEAKENVPIIGALKLTGTNRNGLTIGLIQSLTAQSTARVNRNGIENREVVEPLGSYTVGRVQKNWQGNTLLGGMLTFSKHDTDLPHIKSFMPSSAVAAGIDFVQYFNNRLYYIDMKAILTSVNGSAEAISLLQNNAVHYFQRASAEKYVSYDINKTSLSGTGGYVKAGRKGNSKWSFSETYEWMSPGFDMNDAGYLKQADLRSNTTAVEFRQTNVWRIFRSNQLSVNQKNVWDYGGNALNNFAGLEWKTMLINRYELSLNENYGWNQLDTRILRGEADLRHDPYINTEATFNTDKAKRLVFNAKYSGNYHVGGHRSYNTFSPNFSYRAGNHILFSGQFDYSWNNDELQYVASLYTPPWSSLPYEPVIVMGNMSQHTYGLTIKLQANITPDISIQFYGSPFTSVATYNNFKKAADTRSSIYEERFHLFNKNEELSYVNGVYTLDNDRMKRGFLDPNFSFNEFRSNIVGRWEFRPGSTLYLVWERRMSQRNREYVSGWGDNLERMSGLPSTNTLMLKVNYWLNL